MSVVLLFVYLTPAASINTPPKIPRPELLGRVGVSDSEDDVLETHAEIMDTDETTMQW